MLNTIPPHTPHQTKKNCLLEKSSNSKNYRHWESNSCLALPEVFTTQLHQLAGNFDFTRLYTKGFTTALGGILSELTSNHFDISIAD